MKLQELIKQKRNEIIHIAARHGASHVRLIGSVARNEGTEQSDIDFLVRFEPNRSLFDHISLIQELEALLNCKVDVASEAGLRERVRETVEVESVVLL
ncbi:MAG TPA: nucleotidyltransferase family protein [bacterium]|nr:nucleotidyltransferase family protein [bacterium]HPN45633.1 nucleotidyltransferase family protein [bacterium]